MCVCLNCQYINFCLQYFFIEKNHSESNLNKNPTFLPLQSIIDINFLIIYDKLEIELDIVECLSFKEKPAKWNFFY
jgi:hypothetical protein